MGEEEEGRDRKEVSIDVDVKEELAIANKVVVPLNKK